MTRELYRFTESIPSNAGYANYYLFKEGAIAYILDYGYGKYCVLCNEEGKPFLVDRHKVVMYWSPNCNTDFPVWEDKLEPYKVVEETSDYIRLDTEDMEEDTPDLPIGMDIMSFMETLECFEAQDMVYLDTDGSVEKKFIEAYGEDSVYVIMQNSKAKLIAVLTDLEEDSSISSDVDELLNSIDDVEAITVNFNKES